MFNIPKYSKFAHQPLPECLPFILWWGFIICVRLDFGEIALEVHVLRSNGLHAVVDASAEVQDRPENERDVVGNESGRVPTAFEEDAPSAELENKATISPGRIVRHKKLTHDTNEDRCTCSIPSCVWLKPCRVRKRLAIDPLYLQAFVEADIRHRNSKPRH
jgi:hypothetical protein